MIRRMARIGFFTLLFVSLTIIARAEMLPEIIEGMDARLCSYTYPINHVSTQLHMDARARHLGAIRDIERDRMLIKQDERVARDNHAFSKIVAHLETLTPGVSSECDVFLVMGEPDETIDADHSAGFWHEASGKWSSYYVISYGYPRPDQGQKMIAKRFYFTAVGRPAQQMLDVLVTIDKETKVVKNFAYFFKDGIVPEFWEEAMI